MKYSEDIRKQAAIMSADGASISAISAEIGASWHTVCGWLNPERAEKRKVRIDAWRKAHPGCMARWSHGQREKDPERTRAATKRYADKHVEEHRARSRASYMRNREVVLARTRARQKDNPEIIAGYGAKHRALIAGSIIGATAAQKAEIAEIYRRAHDDSKVRCYLCGKLIPKGHRHVDHIQPLSKGGAHRPSNLAVACDKCNLSKNAKLPAKVGVLI